MINTDPMAEALASLAPPTGGPRGPYRTKKGAIKFQPEVDEWSLDRLPEVETEFQQSTGQRLPVRVRGQGAIHDKWKYAHHDSADISLSPNSKEGQALMSQLERQGVPYLAFDRAIPGVSTGEHIHIGRASRRLGQSQSNRPVASAPVDDPMAEALREIGPSQQQPSRPARPTRRAQPARPFTSAGPFQRVSPEEQEMLRSAVDRVETRKARGSLSGITAGVKGEIVPAQGVGMGDVRRYEDREARIAREIRPQVVRDYFGAGAGGVRQDIPAEVAEQQIAADPRLQEYIEQETQRRAGQFKQREQRVSQAERGIAPPLGLADKIRDLRDKPEQLIPFLSSVPEFDNLLKVGASVEKLERGETLSEEEQLRLRELIAADKQDKTLLYQIADTVSALPAFVGEFATTGGVFSAGRKAAIEGLEKLATKKGIEAIEKRLVGRLATKSVTSLAGAAAQTLPAGATRMPVGVLYREQEGADFATALRDTLTDQFIEVASERTGGALSHIPLPKRLSAIRDAVTARWIQKAPGRTASQLKKIVDKAGWHGPLGEIFEERVGDVARYATGLQKSPVPSLEQLAVEGLAFSIPGASLAVANKALSTRGRSEEAQSADFDQPAQPAEIVDTRSARPPDLSAAPESDPMADALEEVTIGRAEEPYAGPAEFRGMGEGDLYELAARRLAKGTSKQKRLEIIRTQAGAIAEIDRRQTEGQPTEFEPPDTGLRAEESGVPGFQEYVENRPEGGTRFETLEPGSPDFNRLAGEYVERYGSQPRSVAPAEPERIAEVPATSQPPKAVLPAQADTAASRPVAQQQAAQVSDPLAAAIATLKATPAQTVAGTPPKTRERVKRKELPPVQPRTVGRESKAVTERGSEINTRYAVVDSNDLTASHDSALQPNPDFPPELQPRERGRAASADQVSRISSQLRPEFLGESPKASEGAPIIGPDGIVESGNGRVLGIRKAYEATNRGSQAYRRYILENAERFGLDREEIATLKTPVLVRIRTSEVDRSKFVKEANEQSIASMSPVEQARSDATSLRGALLNLFQPSETGDIATTANMHFVRAFMKDVVGPNEVGRYVTASGQVSQEGVSRIRNAIFARAYGDSPQGLIALAKLAESPDSNVRNITTAMLRNAPGFASLKEGIDQGTRHDLDLAPDVAAAMSKLSSLRETGMLVPDYLKQGALYGDDLSPIQKRLLQVFDENKRGANTIDSILKSYLRGANAAGSPTQGGLFGAETPTKENFLEAAILEAVDAKEVSPSLFTAADQGLQTRSQRRRESAEANERVSREGSGIGESSIFAPPLVPPERSAAEVEGQPLGRFDSAIDRLKAHEELARQRLAERGAEFQKLLDSKGSELGATTIPQDLYDYVVIGASKLAQRSLNVAQFVDEMVKEFGEAIREHARAIFKYSRKMVADTQKEIREERVTREIADRLFTQHVPKDQQRRALRIAAKYRTSTDTQGKFLSGFKSRVGEMAKSYGAAGGELTNRVHLGDITRAHEMEAGNKFLSKIQDVYAGIKNDFERQRISDSVIKALEDRANADRHLDTAQKTTVFENTVAMLDMFRAKLKALGYQTRNDYFTHIRDVDVLDQILSDAKDPKDTSLNEIVAARSRFLQPRDKAQTEIKKDLPRVLLSYLKSVTKEIAYSDAVEYYYGSFVDDIPIGLRKNSMDRAIKLMQNSLKPEQGRGQFFRAIGRLRSEQYRNFLAYNLKASAMNFTQVDFARMRWTKEASKLTNELWNKRKTITGPLADAISIASTKETPLMRFLEQFTGEDPSGTRGRFAEAFNKYDPFQRSESRNWGMSELGSIINSVVKKTDYKTLKAQKGSLEAINELLKQREVFDSAVREAATTAAETQVASNPAARGEFYDAPLHRILGMFTAFKTRQLQILGEALRSHEGIDGARAQTILRRGLSGDAAPVEVLREIQAQREAMQKMLACAVKFKEDIGIPRRSLNAMVNHLKEQEGELNGIIRRIEPLSGSRRRSALLVAKYFAKVSAISVFFNLFWDSVYTAISGPEEEDKDAEERLSEALRRAFWDVAPSPFYGGNPARFLVPPVTPNLERSAPFGKMTKRGLATDVVSYGTTIIPLAGIADRASNRWLSKTAVNLLFPKKEREQKAK